jgi:hypothetical protein
LGIRRSLEHAGRVRNIEPELASGELLTIYSVRTTRPDDRIQSLVEDEHDRVWVDVMPRVGVAFQWYDATVVRAGYGVYNDSIGVNTTRALQTCGIGRILPSPARVRRAQISE